MIPTIERIIEGLLAGEYTKQQAIGWLHQHAEDAGRWLRDDFAAAALQGLLAKKAHTTEFRPEDDATYCYRIANAMLKAREMGITNE